MRHVADDDDDGDECMCHAPHVVIDAEHVSMTENITWLYARALSLSCTEKKLRPQLIYRNIFKHEPCRRRADKGGVCVSVRVCTLVLG